MDPIGGTFGERRGEFDIVLNILRLAGERQGRTRIMYAANLSHAMLRRYLDGLEARGFVVRGEDAYALTERGEALRRDMERIERHFRQDVSDIDAVDASALRAPQRVGAY